MVLKLSNLYIVQLHLYLNRVDEVSERNLFTMIKNQGVTYPHTIEYFINMQDVIVIHDGKFPKLKNLQDVIRL